MRLWSSCIGRWEVSDTLAETVEEAVTRNQLQFQTQKNLAHRFISTHHRVLAEKQEMAHWSPCYMN